MSFEDFEIKIGPSRSGAHSVYVLSSPVGQGSGEFRFTFSENRVEKLLMSLDRSLRGAASRDLGTRPQATEHVLSPEEIGDCLFRSLFTEQVLALYQKSLGVAQARQRGLRLRIHLDPLQPDLATICRLPWELLRRDGSEFLGLDRLSPIVRFLDVDRPTVPVRMEAPLRVLVAIANPNGLTQLDLVEERRRIESAWADLDGVEVQFLQRATRKALMEAVTSRPVHVLHFMGHGGFDQEAGVGTLLFETGEGEQDPLSSRELVTLLRSSLPAVAVLNACETARNTTVAGLDPFAGVAAALVKEGLLAVVAMQFPISDEAALAFGGALYRRLAAGEPVDAAVTEGRLAIFLTPSVQREWATPVLFLRAPDGNVISIRSVPQWEEERSIKFLNELADNEVQTIFEVLQPSQLVSDQRARIEQWLDIAARRGGMEWRRFLAILLAARSSFSPFQGSMEEWCPSTEGAWQVIGETLVGFGEDPDAFAGPDDLKEGSLITWEGLPFTDGTLTAEVELPLLARGGSAGLALSCSPRAGLLGLLRCMPAGPTLLELWQRQGNVLVVLGSTVFSPETVGRYGLSLSLHGRAAALRSGDSGVEAHLGMDPFSGFAGLVKFAGTYARFGRLRLDVPFPKIPERRSP